MRVEKPTVFNYRDYEDAIAENKKLRDRLANEQIRTRITVADILEDVKADMCDEYCRWPELLKGEPEDRLIDLCNNCPLERL